MNVLRGLSDTRIFFTGINLNQSALLERGKVLQDRAGVGVVHFIHNTHFALTEKVTLDTMGFVLVSNFGSSFNETRS